VLGAARRCAAESAEDDVGLEVVHGAFDEELDGKAGNELAPAQRQARQLAACDEFVNEVIGDFE
jgi:hypothetical protein